MKNFLKKLIFPFILALVIWTVLFFGRRDHEYYQLDALWLTGLLLLLQALLFWVSQEGVFDTIQWGFKKIVDMFRRETKFDLKYHEYVDIKRSRKPAPIWPSLLIGGLLFLAGVIWWAIIS